MLPRTLPSLRDDAQAGQQPPARRLAVAPLRVRGLLVHLGRTALDPGPGDEHDDLEADLHVTTAYRTVLAGIVEARFGSPVSTVLPGLTQETLGFRA
jgi:hypothetical protein